MPNRLPPPPQGFDPKRRVFVGKFPVSRSLRYNVWLVWMGVKSHSELTPEQLAYWVALNGGRKQYDGKVEFLASNKPAPKPLPPITFEV